MRGTDLFRRGAQRPALMGILNATPDSFSDGGKWNTPESARRHCSDLIAQGADIIDLGGESTRPGAVPVPEEEERERVLTALDAISSVASVPISIDTVKASVARTAVEHGVGIINDVSGLSDPLMAETAAELDVPIILTNCHGTPATFATRFIQGDIFEVIVNGLRGLVGKALDAGVKEYNIILDPGVGFGTTSEQCMQIVKNASCFSLGKYPVLIGPSRKRFIREMYSGTDADVATAEVCVLAAESGADILRIHNVGCTAARLDRAFRP